MTAEPARARLLDEERNRAWVDLARAAGILLVILFHVYFGLVRQTEPAESLRLAAETPWWLSIAWQALGSEIVFLTSSFLLCYLLVREHDMTGRIDYPTYVIRRIARIVPMYYLALVLYALASGAGPMEILRSALFLATILGFDSVVPVGWSMEAMMQAYLLLPPLVLLALRSGRPLALALGLVAASIAFRAWGVLRLEGIDYSRIFPEAVRTEQFPEALDPLYLMVWFRATPFLAGLALALLASLRHRELGAWLAPARHWLPALTLGAVLVLWAGFQPVQDGDAWVYRAFGETYWALFVALQRPVLVAGLCLIALVLFYAPPGRSQALTGLFHARPWRLIAEHIYAIYLFHFPCILIAAVIVFRSTDPAVLGGATLAHVLAIWIVAAALSLLVAIPLTRLVELPFRRRVARKGAR